jgi:hypothetical protein
LPIGGDRSDVSTLYLQLRGMTSCRHSSRNTYTTTHRHTGQSLGPYPSHTLGGFIKDEY